MSDEVERHISQWVAGKRKDKDRPYRDPDVLTYYYWDREMSQADVGNELGVSKSTVGNWLERGDVGSREPQSRVERATFQHANNRGHEHWVADDPDGQTRGVGVHQLLAVADGADPFEVWDGETNVHHRTGIHWLNLPGFVEVVTHGQHARTHAEDEWSVEEGLPVLETHD
jgi:hypothetical protein